MRVKFNDAEEFLAELFADAEHVEDKILRLTRRYIQVAGTPIRHLQVVASCVIRGKLLLLEHYAGELWQLESDRATFARASAAFAKIQDRAQELGLTVRPGVFEEVGNGKK